MGLSASSVIPLLSKWEEYLGTNSDGDITGFARWLLSVARESSAAATPSSVSATPGADAATSGPDSAALIQAPFLITHLYRELQQRSKPIAKQLGLTNSLELDMLVHIATLKDPNKKQVCQEMLIESSTGVEIAKRLVAKGFLREQPDTKDRRAARLSLTVKGKETVFHGYKELAAVHSDLLSTLRIQLPPLS
ncbi:MAG TPA: MarR family winged helix-turn-helix transcriptional regulator [Puia sp.]|nr:MarR family winged helix-turn-helix transcriptional regulator [Puia sp.]